MIEVATGKPVHVFAEDFSASSGSGGFAWADQNTVLFTTVERINIWKQSVLGGPRNQGHQLFGPVGRALRAVA